jgi:hypothetical protein
MRITKILFSILTGVAALMVVNTAWSQIAYDGTLATSTYTQNFDSLGTSSSTWTDDSTLLGWYLAADLPITSTLAANTGSASGNNNAYNLGVAGQNPVTDRALGWISTTSKTGTTYTGLQLQNTSGQDFVGTVTFSFTFEQWSAKNSTSDPLSLDYQANVTATGNQLTSSGWTQLVSIDSPNLSASGGAIDGNASGNFTIDTETVTFTGASPWIAGDYLWFRTLDQVISGLNDMNAIDDVSVSFNPSPVPEPSARVLFGLGVFGLVMALRRLGMAKQKRAAAKAINAQ